MKAKSRKRIAAISAKRAKAHPELLRAGRTILPSVPDSTSRARSKKRNRVAVSRRKPIAKRNPERQAKAAVRQRAKHAAYMKSETRRIVDMRAAGQCEATLRLQVERIIVFAPKWADAEIGIRRDAMDVAFRCMNDATDHHHVSYARYGGRELPKDILKCCKRCHDFLESMKPTSRRRRSSRVAAEETGV